ncbi:MAG: hypothetical protein J6V54_09005 [Bacteroidales bacterium]|nr:hypothetical protein [Bacteroidales bacterium]
MKKEYLIKLYLYLSWLMLVATCLVAFILKNTMLSMLGLILAIAFRYMSERSKCVVLQNENQELKDDMRRLTTVLEDMTKGKTENN